MLHTYLKGNFSANFPKEEISLLKKLVIHLYSLSRVFQDFLHYTFYSHLIKILIGTPFSYGGFKMVDGETGDKQKRLKQHENSVAKTK